MTALSERDREILTAWMDGPTGTTSLAEELGLDVLELIAWANRPDIAAILESITAFALARAQTFLIACKSASLARLLQIVQKADDDRDARRAASAVLRFNPRALSTPPATEPTAAAMEDHSTPTNEPTAPAVDEHAPQKDATAPAVEDKPTPAMTGVLTARPPTPLPPARRRPTSSAAAAHATHRPRAP